MWVALAIVLAAGCRSGFDHDVPGLGDVDGVMVSEPGSLVLEDGHYDIAPTIDGDGYALAWEEFPTGSRSLHLMFAIVGEDATVVERQLVEVATGTGAVRLWKGTDGYLLVHFAPDVVFFALDRAGNILQRRKDTSFDYAGLEVAPTDDGGYAVVFSSNSLVRSVRLDPQGSLIGTPTVLDMIDPMMYAQTSPAISRAANGFAAVWVDNRTGGPRLRFLSLDANARPVPPSVQIFEDGKAQGLPYLVPDGADGFLLSYDGYDTFPQNLLRLDATGRPAWSAPAVVYDEPRYHDTLDVAGSSEGRTGFAWVTEAHTLLTNIEFASLDSFDAPPETPQPRLVTDPTYSFCYPEVARARATFGAAFAGEVEGSLGLFLAIMPD